MFETFWWAFYVHAMASCIIQLCQPHKTVNLHTHTHTPKLKFICRRKRAHTHTHTDMQWISSLVSRKRKKNREDKQEIKNCTLSLHLPLTIAVGKYLASFLTVALICKTKTKLFLFVIYSTKHTHTHKGGYLCVNQEIAYIYICILTASDMKARSGSSTMGERVPS